MGPNGIPFPAGSEELARQCALPQYAEALVCSNEALAHVLRQIGFGTIGNMLGIAAFVALPSVILILLFGQTRIFFVMARDGLLPEKLSEVHPKWKTPYIVTALTGIVVAVAAAFLPVGALADIANAGTLYAFLMVAVAVWLLRRRDPGRKRAFRVPALWLQSRGRRMEVAAELGEAEKRQLADALRAALHRWRNPVFDNPQLR